MVSNWSNFCRMSIVHFMAFPNTMSGEGPIVETLRKIAEDPFFGAVEMTWIKDAKIRREVKEILMHATLKLPMVHSQYFCCKNWI